MPPGRIGFSPDSPRSNRADAREGSERRAGSRMRIRTVGILGASILTISACGATGGKSPTVSRPPTPVNLSVYVNDSRVSVSPMSVGAGPVVFVVTNQASHSEALAISASGKNTPLASTAPINPQGTTQVSVNFKPGDYTIATGSHGQTDAALSQPSPIQPASIHIGRERQSSGSDLLQP
jgi:hypothetical protein